MNNLTQINSMLQMNSSTLNKEEAAFENLKNKIRMMF